MKRELENRKFMSQDFAEYSRDSEKWLYERQITIHGRE